MAVFFLGLPCWENYYLVELLALLTETQCSLNFRMPALLVLVFRPWLKSLSVLLRWGFIDPRSSSDTHYHYLECHSHMVAVSVKTRRSSSSSRCCGSFSEAWGLGFGFAVHPLGGSSFARITSSLRLGGKVQVLYT